MSAANILMAMTVVSDLTATASRVTEMILKAQEEGRDVTPDEVNEAKDLAKGSIDKLRDALTKPEGQ